MLKKNSNLLKPLYQILNIYPHFPTLVQIEITNKCNINCKMCFRHFISLDEKHMDFDLFKRIVDKLEGVPVLTLAGYGEPFIYPQFIEAIKYCKSKKFFVQTTSNGLLLNNDKILSEIIDSGLDSLTISVESINRSTNYGHSNSKVIDNIKKLIHLKKNMSISRDMVISPHLCICQKQRWNYSN